MWNNYSICDNRRLHERPMVCSLQLYDYLFRVVCKFVSIFHIADMSTRAIDTFGWHLVYSTKFHLTGRIPKVSSSVSSLIVWPKFWHLRSVNFTFGCDVLSNEGLHRHGKNLGFDILDNRREYFMYLWAWFPIAASLPYWFWSNLAFRLPCRELFAEAELFLLNLR